MLRGLPLSIGYERYITASGKQLNRNIDIQIYISKKQAGNDRYASKKNGYKNTVLNQEVRCIFSGNVVN